MRRAALRIIAGNLRGRRLGTPPRGVRPTSDRVRESLFARLGDMDEARVLDLFAGTGALGIEALSRGAVSLVCVDRSAKSIAGLKSNLALLDVADRTRVMKAEARGAIRRLEEAAAVFDLIFVDPPYDDFSMLAALLESIVLSGLMAPRGVVVVESAKRDAVPPITGLAVEAIRSYGDTSITWLIPEDGEGPERGNENP